MNQIERIECMERMLDEVDAATRMLEHAWEAYCAKKPALKALEAYYTGPQWRQDYEDDCAGKLPAKLKRGVLSEDAVYNLLDRCKALESAVKMQD